MMEEYDKATRKCKILGQIFFVSSIGLYSVALGIPLINIFMKFYTWPWPVIFNLPAGLLMYYGTKYRSLSKYFIEWRPKLLRIEFKHLAEGTFETLLLYIEHPEAWEINIEVEGKIRFKRNSQVICKMDGKYFYSTPENFSIYTGNIFLYFIKSHPEILKEFNKIVYKMAKEFYKESIIDAI